MICNPVFRGTDRCFKPAQPAAQAILGLYSIPLHLSRSSLEDGSKQNPVWVGNRFGK